MKGQKVGSGEGETNAELGIRKVKVFIRTIVLLHLTRLQLQHSSTGFLPSTGSENPMDANSVYYKLPFGLTLFGRISATNGLVCPRNCLYFFERNPDTSLSTILISLAGIPVRRDSLILPFSS